MVWGHFKNGNCVQYSERELSAADHLLEQVGVDGSFFTLVCFFCIVGGVGGWEGVVMLGSFPVSSYCTIIGSYKG